MFLVRPYGTADRPALERLWADVFPDDPARNAPGRLIDAKLEFQPDLLLVGTIDGVVAGAVVAGYDGTRGWLYHLAVAPQWRRRGLATQLVREAEHRLFALGCMKINLQVRSRNVGVVAFYEAVGYQIEDRVSMGRARPDAP